MLHPPRRGRLEPVRLTLVQRMGNKKVTLVDNLDMYGIPPTELAQTMQRVAAASSTGTVGRAYSLCFEKVRTMWQGSSKQ